ncbi:MAG TPA: PDZ domain-containing protein [Methylomirabilota bacterium]|nr:PDZ domain-containing protein [Methylomirabilota bacterium]
MRSPSTVSLATAATALVVACLHAGDAGAAELGCTVRSVQGATVTLACDGGVSPRVGDPVTLGLEVPGVGFVALEGAWKVTLIGPSGEAQAAPEGGPHGQPQVGNLARVETEAAAAASPGPPAGAGVPAAADGLPPIARAPRLGIRVATPREGDQGARIEVVDPGSAAERAGLAPGDVVLTLGDTPTPDSAALVGAIRSRRPGERVRIRALRFPSVLELEAVLAAPSLDDPDLQFLVGMAYLNGDGVPPDPAAAETWLRRAAASGSADAAAVLAPRPAQPAADDFSRFFAGQATRQADSGVFVIGAETGNRPAMYLVDPAIRQLVAASGATPLMPPDDIRITPGVVPPAGVIAQIIAGRGALLYIELELKWASIGFAKDRVTVTCYDPSGAKQWSEDAGNTFANSRDHSTQILIDKITKKLAKRTGQACLRP